MVKTLAPVDPIVLAVQRRFHPECRADQSSPFCDHARDLDWNGDPLGDAMKRELTGHLVNVGLGRSSDGRTLERYLRKPCRVQEAGGAQVLIELGRSSVNRVGHHVKLNRGSAGTGWIESDDPTDVPHSACNTAVEVADLEFRLRSCPVD